MLGRKQKALQKNRSADFNPDFIFTEKEGMYDGSWAMADVMSQLKKKVLIGSPGVKTSTLSSLPSAYMQQILELFGTMWYSCCFY